MAPKAASKAPATAGKAPAGKAPATEKKEAGKKTAPSTGDKKKRTKTRKETYSSYIYKGELERDLTMHCENMELTRLSSPQAGSPRHWYLKPCHVHPELVRQW